MSVFGAVVTNAAWRDKPTWAVIATEDKSFDQAMLQHMAQRAGATITDVPGAAHDLAVSQAGVVAHVIATAAQHAAVPARGVHEAFRFGRVVGPIDRKGVVSGKSVDVRFDLGGGGI